MKDNDDEQWEEWPYPGFGRQVSIGVAVAYVILIGSVLLVTWLTS